MFNENERRGQFIGEITGKPAVVSFGGAVPSFFGSTTLSLFTKRTLDNTSRIISKRKAEILNSEIDSAEIVIKPNPTWLALGIFTLAAYGLGIIFLIIYFLSKHRFLVVRSNSNALALAIKGDLEPYERFMEDVLTYAESAKIEINKAS